MLNSPRRKQWRSALTRSRKWFDQSIQEEENEERDQACEEHHDHQESLSNKILWRHLPKEGMTTLTKEEKDQRTLDTYEGLGDIKVQITDSTLQRCHHEDSIQALFDVEAILGLSHDGIPSCTR